MTSEAAVSRALRVWGRRTRECRASLCPHRGALDRRRTQDGGGPAGGSAPRPRPGGLTPGPGRAACSCRPLPCPPQLPVSYAQQRSPWGGRDDGGPPSGRHHLEPGLALCAVLSQQPRKEHHSQRQQKSETRMAAVPGRGARPARRLPRERPPSREPGFGDGPLPRTRSASSLRNVGAQGSALRDTGL